jgi:hypothetical protein
MQVFIIGTPLATAMVLDKKRLNKQIIECQQILDALNGEKAWSNHPCVLQYRGYEKWIEHYLSCLTLYKNNAFFHAKVCSDLAKMSKPEWHTIEYFDQMKRILYTKDPEHYKRWESWGTSDENWYFIDGEWRKYVNGERIE